MMMQFGIQQFGLFCLAVLLLNATAGPDTAYIVGRSLAQGRVADLVSALGISAGCLFHMSASVLGLSAILAASASAFGMIKLVGGLYLIYLGIRMLRSRQARQSVVWAQPRPLPNIFWLAVLTNVLNPKVALFVLSFFPQFVARDSTHQSVAFLLLGVTFVCMSTVWNSGTALLAGTLARRAGHNPQYTLWLERMVGTAFIALGCKLAFSKS